MNDILISSTCKPIKQLRILLVFSFMIFYLNFVAAQKTEENNNRIPLRAFVSHDSIKLRWMPGNIDIWRSAMQKGYKISRVEYDTTFSIEQKYKTSVILAEAIYPQPEEIWKERFLEEDSLAKAAKNLLYNPDLKFQSGSDPTLSDAIQYRKNEEGRFFFMIMLAEQRFDIAEALGLAFTDLSWEPGRKYQYFLTLNDTGSLAGTYQMGIAFVDTEATPNFPAPTELSATKSDKKVVLSWKTKGIDEYYTYYNIERRTSSTSFSVVNSKPFIYMSDEKADSDYSYYTDSLTDNSTEYIYRVVGITSFGNYGTPSDTIHAGGIEPFLPLTVSVTDITVGNDFARMNWHVDPDSLLNRITQIDILRMIDINDSLIVINNIPLSGSDTTYLINNPSDVAYYVVRATDVNNYTYESIAHMIQMADTIPPAKPQGLTGKIRKDGLVVLDWSANTDTDLEGYKVLFSNSYNGDYSQLTSVHLVLPHYETTIEPQFMADSIYYRVFAIDHRFNMSEWSDPLPLQRPDVVAPSQSVINKLTAYSKGIAVYWSLSNSKDVRQFELQRRLSGTPDWQKLMTFDPVNIPQMVETGFSDVPAANYLDLNKLPLAFHSYRIKTVDHSGNISYSDEKKVFPFDSGIRGVIFDYEGYIIPYLPNDDYFNLIVNPNFYLPSGGNLGGNLSNTAIDYINSTGNVNTPPHGGNFSVNNYKKAVVFKWRYSSEFRNLRSFKLYKRVVYQSVASNVAADAQNSAGSTGSFVLVASIDPDHADRLAQLAGFLKGYLFVDELPQKGKFHFEYKLKAEHSDGGFSEYSPIETIQYFGN